MQNPTPERTKSEDDEIDFANSTLVYPANFIEEVKTFREQDNLEREEEIELQIEEGPEADEEHEGLLLEFFNFLRYGNHNILSFFAAFFLLLIVATAFFLIIQDLRGNETFQASTDRQATSSVPETTRIQNLPIVTAPTTAPSPEPAVTSQTVALTSTTATSTSTTAISSSTTISTTVASTSRKATSSTLSKPTLTNPDPEGPLVTTISTRNTTTTTQQPENNTQTITSSVIQNSTSVEITLFGEFCGSSYEYTLVDSAGAIFERQISLPEGQCRNSLPLQLVGLTSGRDYEMNFITLSGGGTSPISETISFTREASSE